MKYLLYTMVFLMSVASITPTHIESAYIAPTPLPTITKVLGVKETISKYAELYNATPSQELELMSVSNCESGFTADMKGDLKNGVYLALGEYQYHRGTFYRFADMFEEATGEKLNYESSHDRIKLTVWIWVNHPEERSHWTTWRALNNGGVYKFFSRLLQKDFVVVCSPYKDVI